ncbi:FAD:protein FMN transferase [Brevibacillus daliensis]|uniref:FAD:protein FMN transferase n=1 Tax=Brevibacillus daliensis TaxID=2892995 RepID=UPI001E5172F1|nr:FAD:protein FMN transferase [Brevibacillus daliensis]
MLIRKILFTSCMILSLIVMGCETKPNEETVNTQIQPKSQSYFIYDTLVTVRVYDNQVTSQHFAELDERMKEIEGKLSRTLNTSELYKVNENAGISPVVVSDETYKVVEKAMKYAEASNGKFNPAIGPLVSLWNIGHENAHVPTENELAKTMPLINYRDVELNDEQKSIYLKKAGMAIDLGGIGKGYAADQIAEYLVANELNSAIIDLGGNIFALGKKPDGSQWTIGIQDPEVSRGNQLGKLKVENKTIVTSGVYERYFVEEGKHYHHIFDPSTGFPADNGLVSVSIITDLSADADALSTTGFVLGLKEGLAFMEKQPNVEAIFITKDKKVYITPGLEGKWELTNDLYEMADI